MGSPSSVQSNKMGFLDSFKPFVNSDLIWATRFSPLSFLYLFLKNIKSRIMVIILNKIKTNIAQFEYNQR